MRLNNRLPIMPVLLLIALIICSVYLVIQLVSKEDQQSQALISNVNYINSTGFSIRSDSTNLDTIAKGTIFAEGKEGVADRISIIATIDVDPNDWGGVAFYIPTHWSIVNITSSYPDNKPLMNPSDKASIWTTADTKSEWQAWVEVGRERSYQPTGGGHGTVVIELVYDGHDKSIPNSIDFAVEVGSKTEDGVRMMGPDHVRVPVSLLE
ncbi:hypothetical protein H8B09_10830 [Paenibacillus sp. PR3]|uniref:Uncharacterized protein n=1 Tax=Paenibacillus terricola TaxID=2763503 RepID=A0ABR8MTK2_9BACL|nr:hypothetical protein [Paenibacillus terricola]MBD3919248.1 hypothetical protein [Paenibacillus terricola]